MNSITVYLSTSLEGAELSHDGPVMGRTTAVIDGIPPALHLNPSLSQHLKADLGMAVLHFFPPAVAATLGKSLFSDFHRPASLQYITTRFLLPTLQP